MAAISIDGLTKDYGEVLANDDVTFTVERGEIFGYLGPNGAGKTTTIRTLLGFLSPTAGEIEVLGRDVTDEQELIEAKRRIGYLPDDPQFDAGATGRDVLELHTKVKGDRRSDDLLELFRPPLERPIREYSHGNVRKLGLVLTFMHEPELVILDEPTSGLDPLMVHRLAAFLRGERDRGRTVFFSSHVLGDVRRLCDRVGIIRDGRLVTVEPIESLLQRSGKVVRLVSTEPIPAGRLEGSLDGVHDLQIPGPDGDGADADDGAADSGDATDDVGEDVAPATTHEYTFTFTGNVAELVSTLDAYPLVDVLIEEAPLEDVFLQFYGDDDGQEKAIHQPRVASTVVETTTGDSQRTTEGQRTGATNPDERYRS